MAARDIERYNLDYTIEENLYRWVKRGCIAFAGMALTLGALDIVGIHSISTAGTFWRSANSNLVLLGKHIRTGISDIALLPNRDDGAVRVPILPSRPIPGVSPIDRLAAVRNSDAIEVAMAPPVQKFKPEPVALTVPEPVRPAVVASAPAAVEQKPVAPKLAELKSEPKTETKPASVKMETAAAPAPAAPPAANAPMRLASVETSTPAPESAALAPAPVSIPLIQLGPVPLPTASPGVPPPSPAERLKLDDKQYAKAQRCLANAIYFESRSKPVRGQMAVAQVVLNRTFSGFYPNNVCDVVYQNAHRRLACQFTFACDGKSKAIHDRGSWSRANRIARQTLDGQIYLPEVGKSTHYHAAYVHPIWAREMRRLARYGLHSFYRPFAWGNGAEMPAWGRAMAQAKKTSAR